MLRLWWLVAALCAVSLAACGGDDESTSTDEVRRPELTVPKDESTESTDTTETESTDTTDTAPPAETGPTTTSPDEPPLDQPNPNNGGTPAPDGNDTPRDSPENDVPPEPGSPEERFEQFCEENPGAC